MAGRNWGIARWSMHQLDSRLTRLEAHHVGNTDTQFEFGTNYIIARDADKDAGIEGGERTEYSFHRPTLKQGEYISAEMPLIITGRQLEALLVAVDGKTRTLADAAEKYARAR